MAEINRFSTLDLPSGLRFKVWRERLRRSFGDVSGSSRSTSEFTAWSEKLSEGGGENDVTAALLDVKLSGKWKDDHFNISPSSCRQLT